MTPVRVLRTLFGDGRSTSSSSSNSGMISRLCSKTGSEIRPRSKRRSSRPATISSVTPTVTPISALGNRFRTSRSGPPNWWIKVVTPVANWKGRTSFETSSANSCWIWLMVRTTSLARSASRNAAGVATSLLPERTNNSACNSSARLCSCRLTAPGERWNCCAACVMLEDSSTARNSFN